MPRMLTTSLFGVASVFLALATGVLMLILAVSPLSAHRAVYAFPLAAAVIQICSSCTLVALIFFHIRRPESQQRVQGHVVVVLLGILPSVISAALIGAALGWGESSIVTKGVSVLGLKASTFVAITFILWGVTVLAHLLYYLTLAWVLKSARKMPPQRFPLEDTNMLAPQMVDASRPHTATSINSNPFQERTTSSPPSLVHSDGPSSLRSSFSTIQRPSSSKRGLILRHPSYKQQSRASSDTYSVRPSQDEGFDTWDTSGVSLQIRETMLQTQNLLKTSGLEPIPGSRSPSPAKALEGPFFESSPSVTPPTSPLPQPSVSQPNSAPTSPVDHPLNLPNFSTMFPPPSPPPSGPPPATPHQHSFSRPGSRSGPVSRSGSVAFPRSRPGSRSRAPSEDHIHPLFRTSSPTPPPSASANTTVTAAPEGGQLIDEHILKRMRSGSPPSGLSPLARSESSTDVRNGNIPPSPSLGTMPVSCITGPRPDRPHQRKRSASLQSSIA